MPKILMYLRAWCPYCRAARALLDGKGLEYESIDVDGELSLRQEMEEKSGRSTVPQIFIDGKAIGGHDDLVALDRSGELDALLK